MIRMDSWNSHTPAEQALLRAAMNGNSLAGLIQQYGTLLRWAGSAEAPPGRSYTEAEQRAVQPGLAQALHALVERGLITVRRRAGAFPADSDPAVEGSALTELLADPATWLWKYVIAAGAATFNLASGPGLPEQWWYDANPTADPATLPGWDGLDLEQQEVLVCAAEASGFLTGPFGIWGDLPDGLGDAERLAFADQQIAPLLPYVLAGWIEVIHSADPSSDAYTVIPADELRAALADPAIRYDGGSEWGVGLSCRFTYEGVAVWRAGWSEEWGRRLSFD